ncbi:hypothetical protein GCK72_002106 [Caenorhabditis remanei]|uniref:SH3 domain-containing protein n=1 Tax=Caenorhabditis remanei TaxID=31234 RepID=A0A6A5HQV0_CAERE|nr:hypothetical protein GCK72_002106 [Caenorhabditis remanei]KAF1770288.1 hypothetical protein GCK72_002106 [Caenorhabditis remanei]
MAQVESEVTAGNVRSLVNRLSRDMSNRNPFSVHQSVEKRAVPPVSSQPQQQLYIATYAYSSKQEDELSFVVGDIIELISEVEDGWSKGKLKTTGAVGMFPTNFVTLKAAPTVPSTSSSSTVASSNAARPKTGTGDVVMRVEPKAIDRTPSTILLDQSPALKISENKFNSTVSSATPASVSTESPSSETAKTKEMARVKFVYNPQHDDELALKDIDMLLNITNKNCGDAGWFEGELNGKKGLFPDNFVELVQVPLGTESGMRYASISRATNLTLIGHKPPPVNPPQPAVPPKPAKIVSTESTSPSSTTAVTSQAPVGSISTASSTNMPSVNPSGGLKNNNFAALREKMSKNLNVVAPEKVASIQQKPTEQRDRSSTVESSTGEPSVDHSSGDQVTELQHITKNRARPPKNRPMSMVMNRNRSSDESPTGRLSSPTSAATSYPMSASMFVPAAKEVSIPSNSSASSSPFKTSSIAPVTLVPPSSASKPALRPVTSNSLPETNDSSFIRKLASPDSGKSPDLSSNPDYVSRAEYDALLDRFRALESRVIALEKHRF